MKRDARPLRAVSALLVCVAWAAPARAYECHEDFAAPAVRDGVLPDGGMPEDPAPPGGGDGRFFTGSVDDGHTCAVCHRGRESPEDLGVGLEIDEGLADGYTPNTTYRLVLTLPDDETSAGSIEVTNERGARVGRLALRDDLDETLDGCQPAGASHPCGADVPASDAAAITDLSAAVPAQDRVVASVDACGAQRLAVDWTAPESAAGPIRIHAVAVVSDASGDTRGDGTFAEARLVAPVGDAALGARVESSCAAYPARRTGGAVAPVAFLALLGLRAARRRRRQRRYSARRIT